MKTRRIKNTAITALVIILSSCAGIAHDTTDPRMIDDSFGFCHARGDKEGERAFLASFGANLVRNDFTWAYMQSEPGPFNFEGTDRKMAEAKKGHVKTLALLVYDTPWIHEKPEGKRQVDPEDFPAWLNYVEEVAKRYGDDVEAFEVWNEPNYRKFWTGNEKDFFELTRQTIDVIKQVAPDTPVVAGSLILHPIRGGAGFLRRLLRSGAVDKADGISVHCYGISPEANARRLAAARAFLKDYGFKGELWVTEMGIPTGGQYPYVVSPEDHGASTLRWITSAYAAGADRIFWYQLYDLLRPEEAPPGESSESFFGVAYHDYELKSGGDAIQHLIPAIQGSRWAPDIISETASDFPIALYPFQKANGEVTAVAWSKIGRHKVVLNGFPEGAVIYDSASGREWMWKPGDVFEINTKAVIITGLGNSDVGLIRPEK